jgi:hypothetical protein
MRMLIGDQLGEVASRLVALQQAAERLGMPHLSDAAQAALQGLEEAAFRTRLSDQPRDMAIGVYVERLNALDRYWPHRPTPKEE